MTSYDEGNGAPDFNPAYGIHLHDPLQLQLQHDAGLILSNIQVLQQFVTSLNQMSSEVMRVTFDREPFPSDAVQNVAPTHRV